MKTRPDHAPASGRRRPRRAVRSLQALGTLLVCACVGGPPEAEPPTDEQLLDLYSTSATYFYEDDNLIQAQEQAVKALEIDPESLPMRRMVGWVRIRLGGNEDLIIAERFFRDLVAEGDDNLATVLGLAIVLERLGVAYDETARAIRAGEREPESGFEPEEYADSLHETARDHWLEARELHEGTLSGGEGSTRSMNGLQRLEALLGNYDDSLRWSDVLLERSAEELETWRRMLTAEELTETEEILFRTNEEAALDLRRNTHLFAATLLHRLGRFREAVVHLDAVVASEPDLAEAYSQRAQLFIELGEYARARDDLNRYIGLSEAPLGDPDVTRAFELIGHCEARLRG